MVQFVCTNSSAGCGAFQHAFPIERRAEVVAHIAARKKSPAVLNWMWGKGKSYRQPGDLAVTFSRA